MAGPSNGDAQLAFVYEEAVRGLVHQQNVVESLNTRAGNPVPMSVIHRELALRIKADMISNWRTIQRIRVALQIALPLLILEILAWLLSIGRF